MPASSISEGLYHRDAVYKLNLRSLILLTEGKVRGFHLPKCLYASPPGHCRQSWAFAFIIHGSVINTLQYEVSENKWDIKRPKTECCVPWIRAENIPLCSVFYLCELYYTHSRSAALSAWESSDNVLTVYTTCHLPIFIRTPERRKVD